MPSAVIEMLVVSAVLGAAVLRCRTWQQGRVSVHPFWREERAEWPQAKPPTVTHTAVDQEDFSAFDDSASAESSSAQ